MMASSSRPGRGSRCDPNGEVAAMAIFTYQPVQLAEGTPDRDALLVFWGADLLAVLVRLSPEAHDSQGGLWFLEAGFGACGDKSPPLFRSPEDAEPWLPKRYPKYPAAPTVKPSNWARRGTRRWPHMGPCIRSSLSLIGHRLAHRALVIGSRVPKQSLPDQ